MNAPPALTDTIALARNRARAMALPAPALFLHEEAAREIKERLNEVNRRFTKPAIVTGFPDFWRGFMPEAKVVSESEVLDLTPGAHDLVLHTLALHWANDPVGQLVQCRHALRPDGLMIAAMMGGQTLHELRAALAEAEIALTGGLSPRVLPMGEIRDLGALLQRAGLALPVADSLPLSVSYETPFHLMRDLRAMGEANALQARHRRFAPRQLFAEAARRYSAAFSDAEGRIRATFEMVFLTGWAPSPDQPKPLRPGSAKASLAEALGTSEIPLPDPAPNGRN